MIRFCATGATGRFHFWPKRQATPPDNPLSAALNLSVEHGGTCYGSKTVPRARSARTTLACTSVQTRGLRHRNRKKMAREGGAPGPRPRRGEREDPRSHDRGWFAAPDEGQTWVQARHEQVGGHRGPQS